MSLVDGSEKSRIKGEMKKASENILNLSNNKGEGKESSGRRRRR